MLVFLKNVTCVVLLYQFPFEFIKGYLRRYMQRLIGSVLSSFGQSDLDQRNQRQKLCLYAKNTFFRKKSLTSLCYITADYRWVGGRRLGYSEMNRSQLMPGFLHLEMSTLILFGTP